MNFLFRIFHKLIIFLQISMNVKIHQLLGDVLKMQSAVICPLILLASVRQALKAMGKHNVRNLIFSNFRRIINLFYRYRH